LLIPPVAGLAMTGDEGIRFKIFGCSSADIKGVVP
jgi:hypothetical protein